MLYPYMLQGRTTHTGNITRAKPFIIGLRCQAINNANSDACLQDCVNYLSRQDLFSNRISVYDDKLEKFRTWRVAFLTMIRGVPLASDEQLNLMIQHMVDGSESKALLEHLNRVYISNPDVGLGAGLESPSRKIWQ